MFRRYYLIKEKSNESLTENYWKINHCLCKNVEPLTDFFQTSDGLIVTLDLPCVEKEKIEVVSEENLVSVFAPTSKGFCFKKVIHLSFSTEPEKVSAIFKKGILAIEIPKKIKYYKVEIK